MLCPKCGQPLEGDISVCTACAGEQPIEESAVAMSMPQDEAKRGKKRKIAVIAAVVAVVALVAVAILTPLKNVYFNLLPADKQMQYVYANVAQSVGDNFGDIYGELLEEPSEKAVAIAGAMDVQFTATATELLKDATGIDCDTLNNATINYAYNLDENKQIGYALTVSTHDKSVVTVRVYVDLNTNEMVVEVPTILSVPIKVPLELSVSDEWRELNFAALPQETFVEELIPRIIKVALLQIEDVERGKEEFTAGGVTQRATCLTVNIDQKTVIRVADAVLEDLKNNPELKKVITDFCAGNKTLFDNADSEKLYDAFIRALNETQQELADVEDNQELFTVKTWVNFKNDILALAITADAQGEAFFAGKAKDGKDVGYEVRAEQNGKTLLALTGTGTEKRHTLHADFLVEANGLPYLRFSVTDMDMKKLRDGQLNGEFTLSAGDELVAQAALLKDVAIKVGVQSAEETAKITIEALRGESSLGTLNLTAGEGTVRDIVMPSEAVAIENMTADMLDKNKALQVLEDIGLKPFIDAWFALEEDADGEVSVTPDDRPVVGTTTVATTSTATISTTAATTVTTTASTTKPTTATTTTSAKDAYGDNEVNVDFGDIF